MHRTITSTVGALLLLMVGAIPAEALQEATPASGLADLGLPELTVTITATGYEGIPTSLEAGRYLVSVTVAEDAEFGSIEFAQPEGVSPEEFLATLAGQLEEEGAADAVGTPPVLAPDATPAEGGDGMGGPPQFVYESTFPGGTSAMAGQSVQVVLDLTPGEWVASGGNPEAPQEPVIFEVTGEMPADLPEPESDATVTMGEYVVEVTEGELAAGPQVVKIENMGAQPHFLVWLKGPDDMTKDQARVVLEEETQAQMTGTPPAYSDLNPEEDLQFTFFSATQSAGTAMWLPFDLEPGAYLIACFFPDIADGIPHAYKGMYTVVEVAE